MRLLRVVALAAAVVLASAQAGIGAPAQNGATYGLGLSSCRAFVSAWQLMGSMQLKSYVAWLDGYLSARGPVVSRDLEQGGSRWALMPWLVEYCEADPLSRFESAADALIEILERSR